jgi:hypothetical protein
MVGKRRRRRRKKQLGAEYQADQAEHDAPAIMTSEEMDLLIYTRSRDQWHQWTYLCQYLRGTEEYQRLKAELWKAREDWHQKHPNDDTSTTES